MLRFRTHPLLFKFAHTPKLQFRPEPKCFSQNGRTPAPFLPSGFRSQFGTHPNSFRVSGFPPTPLRVRKSHSHSLLLGFEGFAATHPFRVSWFRSHSLLLGFQGFAHTHSFSGLGFRYSAKVELGLGTEAKDIRKRQSVLHVFTPYMPHPP